MSPALAPTTVAPLALAPPGAAESVPAWFCVKSQPRHEPLAAAFLQRQSHIQVYFPRVRTKKPTRDGPAWLTEPLFPGYLFARFPLATSWRLVSHAPGVHSIVHFGSQWPSIPESVLEDLRAHVGPDDLLVIPDAVTPGDHVLISGGVFNNLSAVVTRVMASRERVEVLLDFLGRQSLAHIPSALLIKTPPTIENSSPRQSAAHML